MTKSPLKVLYIEDSEDDAELVYAQLSLQEFDPEVHRVETADELRNALQTGKWDVVLADFSLPRFSATAALELLRKMNIDLPFIVVSGTIGEQRAIEMMRSGAHDFVLKGDMSRLIPAIRREVNEAASRSARRIAERALSVSEASFKELADAMPQLVWTLEGNGDGHKVAYVNAKWREYFGWDHPGPNWWAKCVHPDDIPSAKREFDEAIRDVRPFEFEYRLRRHDGVYRWFLTRGVPARALEGHGQRWFGTSTDIEEAKKREQKESFLSRAGSLLSSSLDYEKTLTTLANLVVDEIADWCTIDIVGEDAKPRTLAVAHRDPEKVKYAIELQKKFPPNWNATTGAPNVLRTGIAEIYPDIPMELLNRSARSEDELHVLQQLTLRSAMIVPLKFGKITKGTISFLSATQGRSYSSEDLAFAEELARKASVAIENAEHFRRAEKASRAKTDFLANMSHEIRTPLGAILGFTDLMTDPSQSVKDRMDCISVIRRNGEQLSKLIDEILDLTKIEASRLELEKTEFGISELVEDVSTLLSVQAEAKGLQLTVNYCNELPAQIVSDPTRVRQVLINVIGNAIKFTSTGGVSVKIRKLEESTGPDSVGIEFSVTDTGIGVAPEQASRLFQSFVQGDSSMTRKFGGTGLGLALSRKLAQALGGDLQLMRTAPGEGSTFTFTINAKLVSDKSIDKSKGTVVTGSKSSSAGPELKGKRVLVVDDAPDNRVLVTRYLLRAGAEVDSATDGATGAQRALENDYHVVLMDLQMPIVDGFGALKILEENGYTKPVIALTAHAMQGDRERCLAAGFSEHLSKPIDRVRLIQMIRQL